MNFLIGAIGANLTFGLVTGVTAAFNGVYTATSNIINSTSTGAYEVKKIIEETDLEVKIKTAQLMLCELVIDERTPYTIQYCIQTIRDAITEIANELEQIYYRMQYNDNLWVGKAVRSYRFHNSRDRLHAKLKNLESRCNTLMNIVKLDGRQENRLIKNKALENDVSQSLLQIDDIDPQSAANIRRELHAKLEVITK